MVLGEKTMKSLMKAELDALLAVAAKHDSLFALLLLVTFNHGLRISEVLALTKANVVDGNLVVQRLKGSRKTTQPLLASEREGLEKLAATCEGRFFEITRMTAWRKLQAYGHEAGIPAHKLHPHVLKHTTGRLAYQAGVGIPELQTYLGHVNGKNTMVYLQATEEDAAKAFAAAIGR